MMVEYPVVKSTESLTCLANPYKYFFVKLATQIFERVHRVMVSSTPLMLIESCCALLPAASWKSTSVLPKLIITPRMEQMQHR